MPLLPPWAPELPDELPPPVLDRGDPDGEQPKIQGVQNPTDGQLATDMVDDGSTSTLDNPRPWDAPRRIIGNLAGRARTGAKARRDVRDAVRGVVRALGGSRGATRRAIAGRATAGRLASFLATAATSGVTAAARAFNVDAFLGGDVEVFLAQLVDALGPDGGLTEDAVARAAAASTLDDLFGDLGINADGLGALDRITRDVVERALRAFVANYAFERALQALSSRIELRAISPERAVAVERQVRDFIQETVQFELADRDVTAVDWEGAEGRGIINRVFRDAFAILEAAE